MSNLKTPKIVPGQYSKVKPIGPKKPEFKSLRTVMRLAIGTAALGADEIGRRLKEQQEQYYNPAVKNTGADNENSNLNSNANTTSGGPIVRSTVISPDETEADRLRYALIGMMAQTPNVVADGISTAGRVSSKVTGLFGRIISPVANSRLMKPVRERYDSVAARGESMVDHWIEIGRAEEQAGRVMAQDMANKTVDELVDYIGQKPEVRELIQQQSVGMFDEILNAVQFRAAGADNKLEQAVRKIFRLPDRELVSTTIQIPADADVQGE